MTSPDVLECAHSSKERALSHLDPSTSADDYAALRQKLARAVGAVCPSWLADQRDDIVQVALMRVMDVRRKSEEDREFSSSYLWRTAYSALVDEIRRLRRRQEVTLEEEANNHVAVSPGPEERARGHQIGEGIRDCLGHLVRPRRLAVTLYLQGHTVPQVARLLGWSAKRADNLVYRGLADLRQCLTERGLRP